MRPLPRYYEGESDKTAKHFRWLDATSPKVQVGESDRCECHTRAPDEISPISKPCLFYHFLADIHKMTARLVNEARVGPTRRTVGWWIGDSVLGRQPSPIHNLADNLIGGVRDIHGVFRELGTRPSSTEQHIGNMIHPVYYS